MTMSAILGKLKGVRRAGNEGSFLALCPGHPDKKPSLSISSNGDGKTLLHCHAGCTIDAILEALELTRRDIMGEDSRPKAKSRIVATYDYPDSSGALMFQIRRTEDKGFSSWRPDGDGGWIPNLQGVKRVLYRLPEVAAAVKAGETTYIAEGEKDADSLAALGLCGTTNPHGAGKWRAEYSETLRGADVIVLPDNDEPGREHAEQVARSLTGKARSIKILELPGLGEKGDVSDWIQAGGTRAALEKLVSQAQEWKRKEEPAKAKADEAEFHHTDLGNAQRLVKYFGQNIRCDHERGIRYWYDGKRWKADSKAEIEGAAKETVARTYGEASNAPDEQTRKALARHAMRSESRAAISNMISLAMSEEGIPVLTADFDRDDLLLNFPNGTLNLETGDFRAPRREDVISKMTAAEYRPEATHPWWTDLLQRVTGGDPERLLYLQKAAGYSLTGRTREDKVFVLVSEGGAGKSTFLEGIVRAMGDYAQIAEPGVFLSKRGSDSSHSESLAVLAGARLVIMTEIGSQRIASEIFKRCTGGDSLRASRKFEKSFQFVPKFKLWVAANKAPGADASDSGVWRRLRKIPWNPIPENERDPQIKEWLCEPSHAGAAILAWCVQGCLKWQGEGLGDPPSILDATRELRHENDPADGFFADRCEFGASFQGDAGELRDAYLEWCKKIGTEPVIDRFWGQLLISRGCERKRTRTHGRFWAGIRLIEDPGQGCRGDNT